MKRLIGRPSPAMVVACLALAISLGGVGYAAVKLPKNSSAPWNAPSEANGPLANTCV